MYAAKISHTVALLKPLSAHVVAAAVVGRTNPETVAIATPSSPIEAGGNGSVITATITAVNLPSGAPAYPLSTPGIRLKLDPAPDTSLRRRNTDSIPDVDVWRTEDERVQSLQMIRAEADRNFTFREALDVAAGTFVKLADSTLKDLDVSPDGRWAVRSADIDHLQYRRNSPNTEPYMPTRRQPLDGTR